MKREAYPDHKRKKHAPPVRSIGRETSSPHRPVTINQLETEAHNTIDGFPIFDAFLRSLQDRHPSRERTRTYHPPPNRNARSLMEGFNNRLAPGLLRDPNVLNATIAFGSSVQVPSRDVEVLQVQPPLSSTMRPPNLITPPPFNLNFNHLRYATFENTAQTLRADIEQHGVAVIRNVLSPDQCRHAVELAMSFLNNIFVDPIHNVQMDRVASWRNLTKSMFAKHGGLIQHFHAGQSALAWYVRTIPSVRAIFEQLWGTSNLFCSFDGVNITPPPEATNCGWQSPKVHWLHTDQSEKKRGLISVQGLVNLVDVDEGDATLMVFKGSNTLHEAFFAHFKAHADGDWFRINDEHAAWFIARGCEPIAISARAGDMIFWDSRTIHMGVGPSRGRANPSRWRHVVYVAMFNADTLSKVEVLKRKMFVEEGRTSNHWGTTAFPKNPHTYGGPVPEQRPWQFKELSAEAKRLIAGDRVE